MSEKEIKHNDEVTKDDALFRHYFKYANTGFALTSPEKGFVRVNEHLCHMFGYLENELLGLTWAEITHPEDLVADEALFDKVLSGQIETYSMDKRFFRKDGNIVYTHLTVSCLREPDGKVKYLIATLDNITERKTFEESLKFSEKKFFKVFHLSPYAISISSLSDGRLIEVNEGFLKLSGFTRDECIGKTTVDLNFWADDSDRDKFVEILKDKGQVRDFQMRSPVKSGDIRVVLVSADVIVVKGIQHLVTSIRDITAHVRAEDELRKLVEEKDIMMKEGYHRVKNNLAVVESLLHLQAGMIKDEKAKGLFDESQNRIGSMRLIHERLYRAEDLLSISLSEYLRALTVMIFKNYKVDASKIKLNLIVPDIKLNVDSVVPWGLIVNELVSNSIKHAFTGGAGGELFVELIEERGGLTLVVRDNGVGLPDDFDITNSKTLGMQIITMLVKQLGAKLEINRDGVTEFKVTLKE